MEERDHLGWRRLGPAEEWVWYLAAGISYIILGIWHKWLLNWFVGPVWLVVIVVVGPWITDRVRRRSGAGHELGGAPVRGLRRAGAPAEEDRGKVSFFAIFLGDFTPDFLSKFWVYGITIGDTHYGADVPHQWHRGWPGMGFTHTLFAGIVLTSLFWLWKRNRAFAVGYLLGYAAHALTDVNDSVGTMLLFPFDPELDDADVGVRGDDRRRQVPRRAAYYSSLGLVMDVFWLAVVLASWRVLTREYRRTRSCPPTPACGRGSGAGCRSGASSPCTGRRSSTACAG